MRWTVRLRDHDRNQSILKQAIAQRVCSNKPIYLDSILLYIWVTEASKRNLNQKIRKG